MWSAWQPDRGMAFNSYFVQSEKGNVVVDPLPVDERLLDQLREAGVGWIVLTNRDHLRDAASLRERLGARIAASQTEAPLLDIPLDRALHDGEEIGALRVIALEGMKTPGEIALRFREGDAVIVGDAVWGQPAGALSLPPKIGERERALLSLRRLRESKPRHLLPGDGEPIFDRAFEALNVFLDGQDGVLCSRVNMDDLRYAPDDGPDGYHTASAEIGYVLGASIMGYRAARIPAGQAFCPLHWHTVDEELFLVWEGEPLLQTPHGSTRLRRGDLVAFPAGERGAHKIVNDGEQDCIVLMIASNELPTDVCFYPDSKKLLVSANDLIVRSEPRLTYYDGER